jgi:hypothetical protein
MTTVHFLVHRFTTDIEELDEQTVARLLDIDGDFVRSLCALEGLEGAIVIGGASILDDLSSATQRLCFEAVERLVVPSSTYSYQYFTSNAHAALARSTHSCARAAMSGFRTMRAGSSGWRAGRTWCSHPTSWTACANS